MTQQHARYTWGGDEFLLVEVAEDMSLEANFTVHGMAAKLEEMQHEGLVDIAPGNASLLLRFNPDIIPPADLESMVRGIEHELRSTPPGVASTRIIEVPVWFDDPFTKETMKRFREGFHQMPEGDDLEYGAEINGLSDKEEFIKRYSESPWIVSMVGFVAGLPFLYQLVDREQQLVVPKYKSPRTDTPELTLGHGGCFSCVYAVRGAGGYQMFGILPAPIYQPEQTLPDFTEFSVLFKPGDIVKYRPIDETEYNEIKAQCAAGTYKYTEVPFDFDMGASAANPAAYNAKILEALNGA